MPSRSLGHRAPLLWLVLPFAAGLALARVSGGGPPLPPLLLAVVTASIALGCSGHRPWGWATLLSLTGLLAGFASHGLHHPRLKAWETLPPREARLAVRVERLFAGADIRRTTGLGEIVATDPHLRELRGQRVYFSLVLPEHAPAPVRGATLATIGVLAPVPARAPLASFDGYLAGAGVGFRLTRGRVLETRTPAPPQQRVYAGLAGFFAEVLGHGIEESHPELAGLLRAMMLGAIRELSDEQHTLFMQSGTMHLFAISGLNIGVIAGALQALLLLFRLPPWPRFLIGTALLWVFVEATGGSASAVRAFGMAAFVQAAFVLRQPANVLAALALSAFAVLLLAPLHVFSASFIMSYGIVAALLLLGLPLADAWLAAWSPGRDLPRPAWGLRQRWGEAGWRLAVPAVAIGIATTPVSLLTGILYFQLLTPGALATNLVLIPGAVVVTLGGFASLLCGGLGFDAGVLLCNHAAALVLLWIEHFVRWSVTWPGAFVPARFTAEWIGPAAFALLLATLFGGYAVRWRTRRGGWWPPFVVVGVTLLFGVEYL